MSFSAIKKTAQRLQDQSNPAVSTLRLLMDQHELGVGGLPEIGSKSYVSKILNERDRQLTRQHIEALTLCVNLQLDRSNLS